MSQAYEGLGDHASAGRIQSEKTANIGRREAIFGVLSLKNVANFPPLRTGRMSDVSEVRSFHALPI